MAFLITTSREVERDYHEPGQGATAGVFLEMVDQVEVDTVLALGNYLAAEHPDALELVAALPESGGTVGPLPDGTVIEVRP